MTIPSTGDVPAAHARGNGRLCSPASSRSHFFAGFLIHFHPNSKRKVNFFVSKMQEMLNETRHRAEGQVSAKDDELTRFKIDLSKHRDHVEQLETKCNRIQGENEQLASQLEQKTRDVEDRDKILTNL